MNKKLEVTDIEYKGAKIHAYKLEDVIINEKGKQITKKSYHCHLFRRGKFLNLGQMSDGSPFTTVGQAVNEAKWLVDYFIEQKLDNELLYRFKDNFPTLYRSDLDIFNPFKITDRINIKENLKNDNDLINLGGVLFRTEEYNNKLKSILKKYKII